MAKRASAKKSATPAKAGATKTAATAGRTPGGSEQVSQDEAASVDKGNKTTETSASIKTTGAATTSGTKLYGEKPKSEVRGVSDLREAVDHHRRGMAGVLWVLERVFHYFFVGCVCLLALVIIFMIPLALLACVGLILAIPGYLWYQIKSLLLGTGGTWTSPDFTIITIFWAGFFFTHGWPRLRTRLEAAATMLGPTLSRLRAALGTFAKED